MLSYKVSTGSPLWLIQTRFISPIFLSLSWCFNIIWVLKFCLISFSLLSFSRVSWMISLFFSTLPDINSLACYLYCSMISSTFWIFLFIPWIFSLKWRRSSSIWFCNRSCLRWSLSCKSSTVSLMTLLRFSRFFYVFIFLWTVFVKEVWYLVSIIWS